MADSSLDPQSLSVIGTYRIIYKVIFSYGIFILAGISALIATRILVGGNFSLVPQIDATAIASAKAKIDAYDTTFTQDNINPDLVVKILQGDLTTDGDFIKSSKNLITYKGFILPRNILIQKDLPIKPKSYFDSPNYDTNELENFVKNIIFTNSKQVQDKTRDKSVVAISWPSLITYFNLSCINNVKVIDTVCDNYFKQFTNVMAGFNLVPYSSELNTLFGQIKGNPIEKATFCAWMEKNILITADPNDAFQDIFRQCDTPYNTTYTNMRGIIEVDTQLDGYINQTIYNDESLNAYKLISIQQSIYNDFSEGRMNDQAIDLYLTYLTALLKGTIDSTPLIDPFYKDVTYLFNNKFILGEIQNPNYNTTPKDKQIVSNLTKRINDINQGSQLDGYQGLGDQIISSTLKSEILNNANYDDSIFAGVSSGVGVGIGDLVTAAVNFSFFSMTAKTVTGNDVKIDGLFVISGKKVPGSIEMHYDNNQFNVTRVSIQWYTNTTAVINNRIASNPLSFSDLYNEFIANANFYENNSVTTFDLCSLLNASISTIPNMTFKVQQCNATNITITKDKTVYKFTLGKDNGMTVTVNDSGLQEAIQEQVVLDNVPKISMRETILQVLQTTTAPVVSTGINGFPEALALNDRIQKYLKTSPTNATKRDGVILVEFTLTNTQTGWGDLTFVGRYNTGDFSLTPLYFQKANGLTSPIKIPNVSIPMSDDGQLILNNFLNDPLQYIKNTSPDAFAQYKKALWSAK